MKKIISLLLTAIMVFSILPFMAVEDTFAAAELKVTGGKVSYDGHEHTFTAEVSGDTGWTIEYKDGSTWKNYEEDMPKYTEVGVYTVTFRALKGSDILPEKTVTLVIREESLPETAKIVAYGDQDKATVYKKDTGTTTTGYTLNEGVTVTLVSKNNRYEVVYGSIQGFVNKEFISTDPASSGEPADPGSVTFTVSGAGTYVADGTEHKVVATLKQGDGYTVEYSVDDGKTWTEIAPGLTEPGKLTVKIRATSSKGVATTGDVVLRVIESVPTGTKIKIVKHGSTTKAPLRATPSTSGKKLDSIPAGDTCSYQGKSGEWYKVIYEGQEGYVYYWFVDLQDIEFKPTITTQPSSISVIKDSDAVFKVVAKGEGTLKYQWLENGSAISGATSPSYTVKAETAKDGKKYSCKVTDDNGSVTSYAATLTVISSAPTITSDLSASTGIASGKTMRLTIVAKGAQSYQWYYQKADSTEWIAATGTGAHSASYSSKVTTKHKGYKFKCTVSNVLGTTDSTVTTLTIVPKKPSIKKSGQPKSKTVEFGSSVSFTVTASGEGLSYQWYYKKPKGKFQKCTEASATSKTLTLSSVSYTLSGYRYRCVVKNAKGKATSKTVKLKVYPKITLQPSNVTVNVGDPINLSTTVDPASGTGIKYQWMYKATGKKAKWKKCKSAGAKTDTFTFAAQAKHNGYQYKCKITSKQGTVYTNIITVKVN